MSGTDFFDEDLSSRESSSRSTGGTMAKERVVTEIQRPVGDLNLTRMAKHREEIERQVAESVQELDMLRMRQDEVERKRKELEEQRKKQDDYERSRREIMDRLNQSLFMMEKEELKSERLLELLRSSRSLFKEMLAEIDAIDDDAWGDDEIREELNKALTILDEARVQYNKTIAKVETVMGDEREPLIDGSGLLFGIGSPAMAREKSFGSWMLIGLAASLPLILASIAMVTTILVLKLKGLW